MDNFFDEPTVCALAAYYDTDPDTFAQLLMIWCQTPEAAAASDEFSLDDY